MFIYQSLGDFAETSIADGKISKRSQLRDNGPTLSVIHILDRHRRHRSHASKTRR